MVPQGFGSRSASPEQATFRGSHRRPSVEEVPKDLSGNWELVRLASGRDHIILHATLTADQMREIIKGRKFEAYTIYNFD